MKSLLYFLFFFLGLNVNAQNLGLDSSFGNDGKSILPIMSSTQLPIKVFYENNKYIFIYSYNALCSVNYEGTLNTSFGTNGRVNLNSANPSDTYVIKGAKLFAGNIYVFGYKSSTSNPNNDGFITKISTSGIFDLSFGSNGEKVFSFGENEVINDITFNSSNQIYAIGTRNSRIFLSKINSNGAFDTAFDLNGYKLYTLNAFESSNGTGLYFESNEIFLVGSSYFPYNVPGSPKYLVLLKVDENGTLVNSFGENGLQKIILGTTAACGYTIGNSFKKDNDLYIEFLEACSGMNQSRNLYKWDLTANSLTNLTALPYTFPSFEISPDNKIIFTGYLRCNFSPCGLEYTIHKKNADGTADLSFNATGTYTYRFGPVSDDKSSVFYLHNDGKILLAGYTENSVNGNGLGIIRLTNNPVLGQNEYDVNKDFTIFPNPTNGQFSIVSKSNKEIKNLKVVDINGRSVYFTNNADRIINVENLQKGVYFVKFSSEDQNLTYKLVKD